MLNRLFCYGSLCIPEIMHAIAGREIPAEPAVLDDYACYIVRHQYYPAAVPMAGASMTGLLYSGLTPRELSLLDRYEGTEYRRLRVSVTTDADRQAKAWVYIIRPQHEARLSDRKFNLEDFLKTEAQEYIRGMSFRN